VPKLSRISGKEAVKALERLGFKRIRQKGSPIILKIMTNEGEIGCVVPLHDDLAIGTLRGIIRQAKITEEELTDNL
jgi:predicted RNA binding protein YcfA (HicA-like mRNA interferase family)